MAIPLLPMIALEIAPRVFDLICKSIGKPNERAANPSEDERCKVDILIGLSAYISFADGVVEESEMERIYGIFNKLDRQEIETKLRKYIIDPVKMDDLPKFFFRKRDREDVWKMCYMISLSSSCCESKDVALSKLGGILQFSDEDIEELRAEVEKALSDLSDPNSEKMTSNFKRKLSSWSRALKRKTVAAKEIYDKLDDETKEGLASGAKQLFSKVKKIKRRKR